MPILSQSSHKDFFDLNIPSVDSIENFYKKYFVNSNSSSSCRKSFISNEKYVNWNKKINKIFFRGSITGCETD